MNTTIAGLGLCAVLCGAASLPAHAGVTNLNTFLPQIVAGDPNGTPPDSPDFHIDANLASSPFSGVVSINIRYDNASYICSGTLVGKRSVVTAGHCVDSDGNGTLVDLQKPNTDVRVIFNASTVPGDPGRAIVTASAVSMNPNYKGFGHCPIGSGPDSFCLNDDIAVVTLNADAPADARIYRAYGGELAEGQVITMVGYGTSGNGVDGFTIAPDFRIKRSGQNQVDLFYRDDEQGFLGGHKEVWYADFDGNGQDTFCGFGVCGAGLGNRIESNIGGGDSGGSTFVKIGDEYFLVGNNTFGVTLEGQTPGAFGTYFGGMLVGGYQDYLASATNGEIMVAVPEPGTYAMLLAGLGLLGVAVRRRQAA